MKYRINTRLFFTLFTGFSLISNICMARIVNIIDERKAEDAYHQKARQGAETILQTSHNYTVLHAAKFQVFDHFHAAIVIYEKRIASFDRNIKTWQDRIEHLEARPIEDGGVKSMLLQHAQKQISLLNEKKEVFSKKIDALDREMQQSTRPYFIRLYEMESEISRVARWVEDDILVQEMANPSGIS